MHAIIEAQPVSPAVMPQVPWQNLQPACCREIIGALTDEVESEDAVACLQRSSRIVEGRRVEALHEQNHACEALGPHVQTGGYCCVMHHATCGINYWSIPMQMMFTHPSLHGCELCCYKPQSEPGLLT
jgi:hypothetical protein